MKVRKLTVDDVQWDVIATQDDIPVRGNALASGDDDEDRRTEDWILERLDNGDVWAWASVEVRGRYKGLEASDYLGACCYKDEADFCEPGGYYQDMQSRVLDELQGMLESLIEGAVHE